MVQPTQERLWKNLGNVQRTRPIEPRRRTTSPSVARTLRSTQKRGQEEIPSTNEERGRKLRRTDTFSNYFSPALASTSSAAIYIASDNEEEEQRLNREISDLYQQIKIKKERIEKIRIDRAVRKREIEIRRETRRWLPTLDRVNQVRNEIINNLSESDSDSDMFDDLPSAEELLDSIINAKDEANNNNSNNNNNTSSLNDVD